MLHRSTPRAANIHYIEISTFQYNWLHQFVCLISCSTKATTGSPPNSAARGYYRIAFGRCSEASGAGNHFKTEL
jgi:hypothetical protein